MPFIPEFGSLWIVGCGSMGSALLARWLASGLSAAAVTIIDPSPKTLPDGSLRVLSAPPSDGGAPRAVMLAVKPQMLSEVSRGLEERLGEHTLILSIMAGVSCETLRRHFGDRPVIRAMPNTPARVGRGVTALFGIGAGEDDQMIAEALMQAAGAVLWLDQEMQFDAVTAVSGSGPAYVFRFIEALGAAAVEAGLPPTIAGQLALETVVGAAVLAGEASEPPAVLRAQVTSPNGTTQAGLDALDGKADGLSSLLRATVAAAAARSRALAREAAMGERHEHERH